MTIFFFNGGTHDYYKLSDNSQMCMQKVQRFVLINGSNFNTRFNVEQKKKKKCEQVISSLFSAGIISF